MGQVAHHGTRGILPPLLFLDLANKLCYVCVCFLAGCVLMNCRFWLSISISSPPLGVFLKPPHLPSKFPVINSPNGKTRPHCMEHRIPLPSLRPSAVGNNTVSQTVAVTLSCYTLARIVKTEPQETNPGVTKRLCTHSSERSS